MKYICQHCGKEYEADVNNGPWQKDNTQKMVKQGVNVSRFCCYECGKAARKEKIAKNWQNKSLEERENINKKRKSAILPKVCKNCGKTFIPNQAGGSKNGIYLCSDQCRKEYFQQIPESGMRICEECGKEYYYEKNQGNWNKDNELIDSSENPKEFSIKSHRFCCYECGIKHKEKLRKITNLQKYGYLSPWQDIVIREKMFDKMKKDGTLFSSKPEKEIRAFIESLGFSTDKFIIGDGRTSQRFEIDIYIPEKNIGVEFNGAYFHSINGKKIGFISHNYHYNKSKIAKEKGIELIHIWEDQWANQKDIVKDILKARLGVIDKDNRIYARQCTIKEISTEEYKTFCEKYHMQGYRSAKIKYGLFYQGQLVQISSFSRTRNTGKAIQKNQEYEYEWCRGCIASNNFVIGGTSKLLKHFIKEYDPDSILCYADWNLFNGNGYKEAGFEFDGYTGPDKFYIQPKPILRINRNPHKYKEYKRLVEDHKLWLCYGAGSLRFKWIKK